MAYFKKTDVNIQDYNPFAQPYVSQNSTVRSSQVTSKFEGRFSYGQNNEFWETAYVQNATKTYLEHELGVEIKVNDNIQVGDGYYHISKPIFFYQPDTVINGSTAVLFKSHQGTEKFWGFASWKFNQIRDGFILRKRESNLEFVRISSASGQVIEEVHSRSQWKDPLNGNGPSGLNLDFEKVQMAEIKYSWYGAGTAVLSFRYEGKIYVADTFVGANVRELPIIGNPNLSMIYGIKVIGNADIPPVLKHWGVAVTIDGERPSLSRRFSVCTPTAKTISSTSWTPVLSISLKGTFSVDSGLSKSNLYGYITRLLGSLTNLSSTPVLFGITLNSTPNNPTWIDVPKIDGTSSPLLSMVQYSINSTAFSSAGTVVFQKACVNSTIDYRELEEQFISMSSMGITPVITIAARLLSAGSTTVFSSFEWEEVY